MNVISTRSLRLQNPRRLLLTISSISSSNSREPLLRAFGADPFDRFGVPIPRSPMLLLGPFRLVTVVD